MSLLRVLHRPSFRQVCCNARRCYAAKTEPVKEPSKADAAKPTSSKAKSAGAPQSICAENTVLEGLAWLKDQPPVLAMADDQYPPWLWKLLEPKVIPDDGPGGKAEKYKLRRDRRQAIRDRNFMSTQ